MSLTLERFFSSAYTTVPINLYDTLIGIGSFCQLKKENSSSRALLLAQYDIWTGKFSLKAKRESELTCWDHICQFFFGTLRLENIAKLFERVMLEAATTPRSLSTIHSLESTFSYLQGKLAQHHSSSHDSFSSRIQELALTCLFQVLPSTECVQEIRCHSAPAECVGLNNRGNSCFFNAVMKALWAIPRLHELVQDRRRALLESKSEGGPLSVLTFLTEEHQRFITTSLQDREEKEALCLHLELELLDQVDATFFAISSPHESSLKNTDRQIDELGSALVSCDPRFRRLLNDEQQDASEFLQLFLSTLFPTMNISAQDVFHVEHPDDESGRLPDRLTSSTYFEADQDLSDLPQLLSMQIDRVIPTRLRDVSQAVVEIPIFLSLKNGRGERLADARPRYVLRAVVVHSGAHSQFGHYYTYVPNHSTLQSKSDLCSFWTRHDDRNVQTCCYYDIKSDMERNGAIALYEKIVS